MKPIILGLLACVMLFLGGAASAHSGGTDSQGCHMDHKTGIRHCH